MQQLHAVEPVARTATSTGVLEAVDLSGDTKVYWDRANPAEVAAAKASYDALKSKGYAAYRLDSDGSRGELIREFDPNHERVLMAPQMAGG